MAGEDKDPSLDMNAQEQIDKFNAESGLPGKVNENGTVSVDEGLAYNRKRGTRWLENLSGLDVHDLRLGGMDMSDDELTALSKCKSLIFLNIRENRNVRGTFFQHLPAELGLQDVDVTATEVDDNILPTLCKFPTLTTIWGHRGQFSELALEFAREHRPGLEIKLIY